MPSLVGVEPADTTEMHQRARMSRCVHDDTVVRRTSNKDYCVNSFTINPFMQPVNAEAPNFDPNEQNLSVREEMFKLSQPGHIR